jgi:glutamyl-tRNA reductase
MLGDGSAGAGQWDDVDSGGMQVVCIGISHKTASVELRECLAFDNEQAVRLASDLRARPDVAEALVLSTCNRVELYLYAANVERVRSQVVARLASIAGAGAGELETVSYVLAGASAVGHLFRVAASLDSLIVGEAQILAQIKTAHTQAVEGGCTSVVFNRLFRHALEVGKRVRTETAIGERPVSISSAAVELARQVLGKLEKHTVLILGAGEMSELTATHLVAQGIKKIFVSNRTFSAGQELAERFGGSAVNWDRLDEHLALADIVISSTAAPHYVVTRAQVERAMQVRKRRPLFFIDIAVPRDCDPEINHIDNAFLYDIDDLQAIVDRNKGEREKEAARAEAIVAEEVEVFEKWLAGLEVVPTIHQLRAEVEAIRATEFDRIARRLGDLDEATLEKVKALSVGLVNKILHEPTVRLKEIAAHEDAYVYVEALRRLFGLRDEGRGDGAAPAEPLAATAPGEIARNDEAVGSDKAVGSDEASGSDEAAEGEDDASAVAAPTGAHGARQSQRRGDAA